MYIYLLKMNRAWDIDGDGWTISYKLKTELDTMENYSELNILPFTSKKFKKSKYFLNF